MFSSKFFIKRKEFLIKDKDFPLINKRQKFLAYELLTPRVIVPPIVQLTTLVTHTNPTIEGNRQVSVIQPEFLGRK